MKTNIFFSSRRRHTRFDCDWSSDVCSSDLLYRCAGGEGFTAECRNARAGAYARARTRRRGERRPGRSEERRVGKECRSRGAAEQEKKKYGWSMGGQSDFAAEHGIKFDSQRL